MPDRFVPYGIIGPSASGHPNLRVQLLPRVLVIPAEPVSSMKTPQQRPAGNFCNAIDCSYFFVQTGPAIGERVTTLLAGQTPT